MGEHLAKEILEDLEAFVVLKESNTLFTGIIAIENTPEYGVELSKDEKMEYYNIIQRYPEEIRRNFMPERIIGWDQLMKRASVQEESLDNIEDKIKKLYNDLNDDLNELNRAMVEFGILGENVNEQLINARKNEFESFNTLYNVFLKESLYVKDNSMSHLNMEHLKNELDALTRLNYAQVNHLMSNGNLGKVMNNEITSESKKHRRKDLVDAEMNMNLQNKDFSTELEKEMVVVQDDVELLSDYMEKRRPLHHKNAINFNQENPQKYEKYEPDFKFD